jgi:hypothetical protein|uniref:Arc-like DNA binding domain protein n=1 Tax=Myoviridae sp. ctshb19 TaxID=2825194 RepID=A0A8S5UFX6_9CAUD|nr:MAG TPA: Arc-like DNA binding domain protein [Myoviridae sp. ctshb19]
MSQRKADNYNSRTADKFVVRLPDDMREHIAGIARDQHRSMNSQIIVWLQACIELEEQGIKVSPATIGAATDAQKGPRILALEAMLQKVLGYGDWFGSALEIDVHDRDENGKPRDGENLKAEMLALLANAEPMAPVVAAEKPKFVPREGMPVKFLKNGEPTFGVIVEIYVEHTRHEAFPKQFFRAKLRTYGGSNAYVDLDQLSDPFA